MKKEIKIEDKQKLFVINLERILSEKVVTREKTFPSYMETIRFI